MNSKLCAVIVTLAILIAVTCITVAFKGHQIIMAQNRIIQAQQIKIEKVEKDNTGLVYANKYLKLLNNTIQDAWRQCRKERIKR